MIDAVATSRDRGAMLVAAILLAAVCQEPDPGPDERARPRDLGLVIGHLPAGPLDAITDVPDVRVGHATRRTGTAVRTGVTVILPHGDDPFQVKVPAAVATANGFGKLAGSTQVDELGELETPIGLTNTLAVGTVIEALVDWTLAKPANRSVRSVNAVVGETNDGWLHAIRERALTGDHVLQALADAGSGAVVGGAVGAGTGTRCFGFKGGIGTASRVVRITDTHRYTVGVLVQTNFGGELTIAGESIARRLRERVTAEDTAPQRDHDGSCMIVIATDAPLDARNLRRLARRSFAGMARTGASFSNGSGDYAIAFSNAEPLRIRATDQPLTGAPVLKNDRLSALFVAAAEATEAAIVDSLFRADTEVGRDGHTAAGLPVEPVLELLRQAGKLTPR